MSSHSPVLLHEVLEGLALKKESVVVDLTLGRAGHAKAMLEMLSNGGSNAHLYGFDQDIVALNEGREVLSRVKSNFTLIHANFKEFKNRLHELGVYEVDAILLDLGVSSPQFDVGERGFSYRFDAALDMRMDQANNEITARKIINTYSESHLKEIFYKYAEHPYSGKIARAIVEARSEKAIETTFELVDIIKSALPARELRKKGHPAKTIFQALRIEVNDELYVLTEVLDQIEDMLAVDGRVAVITFHSLEDRIVKQKFKKLTSPRTDRHPFALPSPEDEAKFVAITKKPIMATKEELESNPRAASAKLRIIARRRK
ncbi:MAG: 16S rRNA (cytosine(1402)-N(4))-methyltransferase RsmH [Bacilli bacterium]